MDSKWDCGIQNGDRITDGQSCEISCESTIDMSEIREDCEQ